MGTARGDGLVDVGAVVGTTRGDGFVKAAGDGLVKAIGDGLDVGAVVGAVDLPVGAVVGRTLG